MSALRWGDDHADGVDFGEPQPEAVQEVEADPAQAPSAADAALAADAARRQADQERLAVQETVLNLVADDKAKVSAKARARKRVASPNPSLSQNARGKEKPRPPSYARLKTPPPSKASPRQASPRPAPKAAADAALAADADSTSEEESEQKHDKFTVGCFNWGGSSSEGRARVPAEPLQLALHRLPHSGDGRKDSRNPAGAEEILGGPN